MLKAQWYTWRFRDTAVFCFLKDATFKPGSENIETTLQILSEYLNGEISLKVEYIKVH